MLMIDGLFEMWIKISLKSILEAVLFLYAWCNICIVTELETLVTNAIANVIVAC